MRIGVIGTGNIGGMLASAFAESGQHVLVFNRTACKAQTLADCVENIRVLESAREVARLADVVFLCTKPYEGKQLLAELGPLLTEDQLLVATISAFPLAEVESQTKAGVAKVIPSIVQSQRSGILLVCYGSHMHSLQQEYLHNLLAQISTPFAVADDQIRVSSDLTSCGPAFMACLLQEWAEAAASTQKLSAIQAEHLLTTTLIGVANLLQAGMTLNDVIARVAVPGGVTEAGLACLSKDSGPLFERLHACTSGYAHGAKVVNLTGR